MNALLALPIAIPLGTAAACLVVRGVKLQRAISLVGAVLLFASSLALLAHVSTEGPVACQVGGWPAPFGITLAADLFSALMLTLPGVLGSLLLLHATWSVGSARESGGFHALVHVLLMGVSGAFLAGDLFNLYVWFEVLLIASFVLLGLGSSRAQLEGAIKYVTMNLLASAVFLAAVGLLYGTAGTLNMADLAEKLQSEKHEGLTGALAALFLVAFGIKAAVFPFFFWLPASYHTPPPAVAALFAALLTKVGVYSLIRMFTLVFGGGQALPPGLLITISAVTMLVGVLGAAVQTDMRRILAFHSVSQVGYMLFGLALGSPLALAGAIVFVLHHAVVKSGLFLVADLVQRESGTFEVTRSGGLFRSRPLLAACFWVLALSLAGLPPLSGFFAKLTLLSAGVQEGQHLAVGVALAVSLLTLFSMTKIWAEAFWKAPPEGSPELARGSSGRLYGVPLLLCAGALALGLLAGPVLELAHGAAMQVLDSEAYRLAVLGDRS